MLPPMDDAKPPSHTLSVMCPTATCEYQIVLIQLQGTESRGVHLLRAGLARLVKTYVPQPASMTKLPSPIINVEGVDTNIMCTLVKASTPSCGTLVIVHPVATRDYQISLIKFQCPISRAIRLLRARLADHANTPMSRPGGTLIGLPLEATKCINYYDDQILYARR